MKKISFTILLLAISLTIYSQNKYTQTIRGVVIDATTEYVIPIATVTIENTSPLRQISTDYNGEFKFENLPLGRYNIKVSFIGYKTGGVQNVLLESGKEVVLTIPIEESVIETAEIIVNASKNGKVQNEMAAVSTRTFSVEDTEKYAGSLGDPSRMAANFAGVSSVSDQRNDIIIRGNSPMGLIWKIDGVTVPNPNHFGALGTTGGPVSMLNNNLLANSDFFTGAFPAQYGNGTSGVFDLKMRNGNNQKREYVGQVGFNGFELGAEGPFSKKSKASYLINFRYSTVEIMSLMGIDGGTGASIPKYKDLSFKINVPLKKGKISLFGIGGLSYIELLNKDSTEASYGISGTETRFGSDVAIMGLTHVHYFSNKTRLETRISGQGMRSLTNLDSLTSNNKTYPYYRNKSWETKYAIETTFKTKLSAKNNISIGGIVNYYNFNFADSVKSYNNLQNESDFIKITNSEGDFTLAQAFAEWKHKFTDDLSLYSGIHALYFMLNDNYSIEPRAGMKWQVTPKQSINIGVGMHSQLQPHMSYFVETKQDDGSIAYTNKELDFTKSNQAILGYDIFISNDFRFKFETYYQQLNGIPVVKGNFDGQDLGWFSYANEGANFAIATFDSLENKGTGKNYGVEFTLEKFFSKNYYFLFTSSIFESKYKGSDGIERNTAFNGNYVFNGLVGYEYPINKKMIIALNLRGVFAGGKRKLPILLAESNLAHETVYDVENAFVERYDDYFKIDVRLSFKLSGKKISQEWAIDLQNATNNKNVFQESYNPTTQKIQTDYQAGLYPMFLYRIRF